MLTMVKLTSPKEAATYYAESDDYYGEGARAPSTWWGEGATALKLHGVVDSTSFQRLLEGNLPGDVKMHHGGDGPRMAALDLTFSAPKSISLQALAGGDNDLERAHERAVTAALAYVETRLAAFRKTASGTTESTKSENVVCARFDHYLSRDADPQLHTHAVLLNLTQRPDGEWRALDAKALYEQQLLIGAHYRAELAAAVQALGYRIRLTHADGRFELAHITDAQVAAFSTRRNSIDKALAARGLDRTRASARECEIAGLSTRPAKDADVDRDNLAQKWAARAAEHNVSWSKLLPPEMSPEETERIRLESVTFAVEHLTERQAIVTHTNLTYAALTRGTGVLVLGDIEHEVDRRIASGELLASKEGRHLTTAAARALEAELLAIEMRGRDGLRCGIKDESFAHSVLASRPLTVGQRAAANLILTTRNRIVGVQGLAGTGKTRMLREVSRNIGMVFKPVGLAPSAAAARELESSGIPAMTIASFLSRRATLDAQSLVVIDEAGMVSARDMHAVLTSIDQTGARAVLLGDKGQLKAVEAGAPFAQLQRGGMETARMEEIQRQTNTVLREAVRDAAAGRVPAAVTKLAGSVCEVPFASQRYERIAQDFTRLQPSERAQTMVVAGTHRGRMAINERIRQRLGLAGGGFIVTVLERRDLTRAQSRSSLNYLVGDVVEAQRDYASIGLARGDRARVVAIAPGEISLLGTTAP